MYTILIKADDFASFMIKNDVLYLDVDNYLAIERSDDYEESDED